MLTSITTMAAFSANLFSDIAALRSFGIEAAMGILAAFLLTGLWVPLLRMSFDEWLENRKANPSKSVKLHTWFQKMVARIDHSKWTVQEFDCYSRTRFAVNRPSKHRHVQS